MQKKYWMMHIPGATVETFYYTREEAYDMACKYADQNPTLTFTTLEVVEAVRSTESLVKKEDIKQ